MVELDKGLDNTNDIVKKWKEHINQKLAEYLRSAIKHRDENNIEEIEIGDMGAIDSIEDGIVRCEILNGDMLELKKRDFKYDVEEGDVINLKLTYKEGSLVRTEILDKNDEEKRLRINMMMEKMRRIREKSK